MAGVSGLVWREVLAIEIVDAAAATHAELPDTDSFRSYDYPAEAVTLRLHDEVREGASVVVTSAAQLSENGGVPKVGQAIVTRADGSSVTATWCPRWGVYDEGSTVAFLIEETPAVRDE